MKKIVALGLILTIASLIGLIKADESDVYVVAYRTLQVSDTDIGIEFLEQIQSDLLQYDIDVNFVRWQAFEDRPDNALAYITFREELEEGLIVDRRISLFTQSKGLSEQSPILETESNISFSMYDEFSEELSLGFLLYATGETTESLNIFLSISNTDVDMNTVNINHVIGNIYIIEGDLESALTYLEDYIWTNIGAFTGTNLAWVYLQLGQTDDAFELISDGIEQSYISIEISPAYLLSIRAQLYALTLDYDSAIADIDQAIILAEENELSDETLAELYTIRGEIIFLIYEWDRVEENFTTAIELNPDYARAYFQRGVLFYTMARREDALSDFQMYLDLDADGIYAEEAQSYIESIEIELEALGN